jgi:hypothetical protein
LSDKEWRFEWLTSEKQSPHRTTNSEIGYSLVSDTGASQFLLSISKMKIKNHFQQQKMTIVGSMAMYSKNEIQLLGKSLEVFLAGFLPDWDLPLKLPEVEKYEPSGDGESPLATIPSWVHVQLGK